MCRCKPLLPATTWVAAAPSGRSPRPASASRRSIWACRPWPCIRYGNWRAVRTPEVYLRWSRAVSIIAVRLPSIDARFSRRVSRRSVGTASDINDWLHALQCAERAAQQQARKYPIISRVESVGGRPQAQGFGVQHLGVADHSLAVEIAGGGEVFLALGHRTGGRGQTLAGRVVVEPGLTHLQFDEGLEIIQLRLCRGSLVVEIGALVAGP